MRILKNYWILILVGTLLAPASLAWAESTTPDPLQGRKSLQYSDRVRAIPRRPLLKSGRVELTPRMGISLNDPYYFHATAGGSLTFFPSEFWGIGIGGNYFYAALQTQNLELVRQGMVANLADYELPSTFGFLEFHWIPIYGKLSLFSRGIFHYETYLTLGGGIHAQSTDLLRPAGVASVGQRLTLTEWCTFSVELRDFMYAGQYKVYHEERPTISHYLVMSMGLSFFIPPSFEYSQR